MMGPSVYYVAVDLVPIYTNQPKVLFHKRELRVKVRARDWVGFFVTKNQAVKGAGMGFISKATLQSSHGFTLDLR